jgi:hypothetical protein
VESGCCIEMLWFVMIVIGKCYDFVIGGCTLMYAVMRVAMQYSDCAVCSVLKAIWNTF